MSGSAASGSGAGTSSGAGAGTSSGTGISSSTGAGNNAILSGLGGIMDDKDCDLLCPVCFELIEEAYVTRCGHSFCYACIAKSVELHRRCPKCGAALASRDHIFPNFLLNELVAKRRVRAAAGAPADCGRAGAGAAGDCEIRAKLAAEARRLPLADVDSLLDLLGRRKRLLEAESEAAQHRLVLEFLRQLHSARRQQAAAAAREAALVRGDMQLVQDLLTHLQSDGGGNARVPQADENSPAVGTSGGGDVASIADISRGDTGMESMGAQETFAGGGGGGGGDGDALAARWRRLAAHFDDFVQCYFAHRADELYFGPCSDSMAPSPPAAPATPHHDQVPQAPADTPASTAGDQRLPECSGAARGGGVAMVGGGGLEAFRADVAAWTRYGALRPLATLAYCSDAINYSTIVSTIEFDKDDEFFAIAGVTKRIKVFEWGAVVRDAVDVHYPCAEMACSHKISCVCWNAYHKNVLASSDYEGTVSVWDAATAQRTRALQEHDKRCWSVHFNRCDVRLLASGSDDARVKLWALNAERSVATLEAKFNVCCVRFNPKSSCHLAFGSADHCVHYYDLRAPRAPLCVFKDHRKAVSYVTFLDHRTLVSASTDSQLKLWTVDSARCVRSFTGHANEKNFVGLATDGKYIACGSENNALYVYYSGLARPLLAYRFDALRGFLERERREEEASEFVSAVCWRRSADRPALLAANSQGTIKVLELV